MKVSSRGLLAAMVAAAAAVTGLVGHRHQKAFAADSVNRRLAQRVPVDPTSLVDCHLVSRNKPLVLLVLGQSNGGNHGAASPAGAQVVNVMTDQAGCYRSRDPLPGATGTGGSIWSRLPAALQAAGVARPVVFGVLALDASSLAEWTSPDSPVAALLDATVRNMLAQGLPPDYVLWQQGEADARAGTSATDYSAGLQALATRLHRAGARAKWLLGRSTVCRSKPSSLVHAGIDRLTASNAAFAPGADTDSLTDERYRADGCHFSAAGLDAAAALWAQTLAQHTR